MTRNHSIPGWGNAFVLLSAMLLCGLLSVHFGKELQWDLVSYHYYNPYALFHHRLNFDYWPAGYIHIFFNPAMDFLGYFLIHSFSPWWVEFILGAIHGINFWLIFYLSYFILSLAQEKFKMIIAFILALVGMYGPVSFSEIGSFMGDNLISIFVLLSILLQVMLFDRYYANQKNLLRLSIASGLLLGMAVGLKLTAAYFVLGMLVAYLFLPIPYVVRFKMIFVWSVALGFGFLLVYGYWMIFLWQKYHNPFFPLLNGVFHSPYFPAYNWYDNQFFPRNTLQTFFYPFYFSINGELVSEYFFMDFRFSVIYILVFLAGLCWLWRSLHQTISKKNDIDRWFIVFFITSYVIWQCYFSNIRYLVTLEMLAPLMIYLLLNYIIHNPYYRLGIMGVLFYVIFVAVWPIYRERVHFFGKDYFNVTLPGFAYQYQDAMVLTVTSNFAGKFANETEILPILAAKKALRSPAVLLQTYVIPYFPPKTRFVGVTIMDDHYAISLPAKKLIAEHQGHFYLLTSRRNMPSFLRFAQVLGLQKNGACGKVLSDRLRLPHMRNSAVLLCSVGR